MYPDLIITLMRQMVPHNQTQPFYNPNNCSININDFKYVVSSDRVDITNTTTNYDHITALKFNTTINNLIGIHTSDITSILNDLDQDLKVNVF